MGIKPCADSSAADWIASSALPWQQLVGFGPDGFDRHARLRIVPDPVPEGEDGSGSRALPCLLPEPEQLAAAVGILLKYSTTPDRLFFAFWDGFGFDMPAARFAVPNREFFLYAGFVTDSGSWDIAPADQAPGQKWLPAPAFIWPADQVWCLAFDVDPDWAGIGAGADAIAALLGATDLDVVPADPAAPQP